MLILKQLQTLANNSLAIWQRPEPLLTRAKLSWQYQQQCFRVLQQHVNDCLTDLSALPQQIIQQHEDAPIPPMIFPLEGFAGQTLSSAFLLQNDQDTEVAFALVVESIRVANDLKSTSRASSTTTNNQNATYNQNPAYNHTPTTDFISVQIQPANGRLDGGGAEPIQISVQLHAHAQPGHYLAVVRIQGFVEQMCHLKIQVQPSVDAPQ
jgi:hypothetical protein